MQKQKVIVKYIAKSAHKPTQDFQHVSYGPQPILGLVMARCGLGAVHMEHAGPPRPWSGAMECGQSEVALNYPIFAY